MKNPMTNRRSSIVRTIATVKDLSGFIEVTRKRMSDSGLRQTTSSLWWRGQSDSAWPLTPSLYRSNINSDLERELIRDFKLKSTPFISGISPQKNIEWLFMMQHHGAPTRIIDWSESPLVALYFCVCDINNQNDGAVWVIDPWILNEMTYGIQSIPTANSDYVKNFVIDIDDSAIPRSPRAEHPLALRVEYGFNRAHSQRGAATIHGYRKRPIESLLRQSVDPVLSNVSYNRFLAKIIIDGNSKIELLKSLYEYGIGADILFPGLDGLSKALCFRYDHRYLGDKLNKN